jgi:hypothetical protein
MNFNKIEVNGNQNIVIQDINGSQITLNVNDNSEIKAFFDKHQKEVNEILALLKNRNEPILKQFGEKIYNFSTINTAIFDAAVLRYCSIQANEVTFSLDSKVIAAEIFASSHEKVNILVVTETADFIQEQLQNIGCQDVLQHYSFALEYWKPYRKEACILDLLKEFQEKTGYRLKVGFVGKGFLANSIKWKNSRKKTLLILDLLALTRTENANFAKIFDDNDVGGCLFPLDVEHSQNAITFAHTQKEKTFSHLSGNIHHFHTHCKDILPSYKGLIQIELEVKHKADLFRRLSNIAHYHLEVKPKYTFNEEVVDL